MRLLGGKFPENDLSKSFFIVLFLLCNLILVFSCKEEDRQVEEGVQSPFTEEDIQYEESLKTYLQNKYPCEVSQVIVGKNSINVIGKCTGNGEYYLAEIPPFQDVIKLKELSTQIKLPNSSFNIEIERFVEKDDAMYDRLLSKWAVFKKEVTDFRLVSHAHHVDEISPLQNLPPFKLTTKKGLGGIISNQYISDFTSLAIGSATINVCITQFMRLTPQAGDIAHEYGGRTYYIDETYLKNVLDAPLIEAAKHNIAVAAIILVEPAAKCIDPDLGSLLQHPNYLRGVYTMPNMTNLESVNCYAAAFDFLAKRYCTTNNRYGRIAHWIMHNEGDGSVDWTNRGIKPVTVFADTYIKSMRICYNIVRQYDEHAEVFASLTHSWTQIANVGWWLYTSKEIIDLLNVYSKAEGDFQWALAYHSYSQDLTNPCVWNDPNATFSMDTKFVTFKNLEVISKWALAKENKYKGTVKRSVWLSEAGVNSPTYSDEDFLKQAASVAFAWKKVNALEGIDAWQWHNWFDHPGDGACFGLRKYLDESYNGEPKPAWYVYQKANTHEEDEFFEQFLPIIGISDWNIIENF